MRSYVARASTVALLVILSAWPAGAHSGQAGKVNCDPYPLGAPAVTYCYTGPHDAFYTYDVGLPDQRVTTHGVLLYTNYTGTIESRLEWPAVQPTQSRTFRCAIASGHVVGVCTSDGYYPPPLVHFYATCHSIKPGSPAEPGGNGNWGCYVDHDASPVPGPVVGDSRHLSLKLVRNGSLSEPLLTTFDVLR